MTMRKEFFEFAKAGEFRVSTCVQCYKVIWPNSSFCPACFSKTTFDKVDVYGTIEQVSVSLLGGRKEAYGVVDVGGIRVIGSLFANATPGGKVRMVECGINDEGCFFCRFESFIWNDKSGILSSYNRK